MKLALALHVRGRDFESPRSCLLAFAASKGTLQTTSQVLYPASYTKHPLPDFQVFFAAHLSVCHLRIGLEGPVVCFSPSFVAGSSHGAKLFQTSSALWPFAEVTLLIQYLGV